MPLAKVEIDGRMAADPELQFLPSGAALAKFRVATSDRKREGDQWVDGPPTFISVVCWRDMAENVAESLHRGDPVFVSGKLEEQTWTDRDGQERKTFQVTADAVGPSLRWASASVNRTSRQQGQPGQPARPAADDPWATGPSPAPAPQWSQQQPAQAPPQAPQQAPAPQAPAPQPVAQPQQAPAQGGWAAPPSYDEPPF